VSDPRQGLAVRPPRRYRWLVRLLTPLVLMHLLHRRRKDGDHRYLSERLGRSGKRADVPSLWFHAASVGETVTILPLLDALSSGWPETPLLVTTNTTTGARVLAEKAPAGVRHRYLPLDFPAATRRFLEQEKPIAGWIVETEIWPWLFARAQAAGVPLTIINARLSPRTRRQSNGWLSDTYRRALSGVDVLARSGDDADAFRQLGAEPDRIVVVGELKYARRSGGPGSPGSPGSSVRSGSSSGSAGDTQPSPVALPFVLAASTHANEEQQLARAWLECCRQGLLVIVPRHPERGESLSADLDELAAPARIRRRANGEQPVPTDRLYLADTLGELDAFYAHASGVFVGGSLIERGGHNVLEPARHGCALAVGRYTTNFREPIELLRAANAISECADATAVVHFLQRALQDDALLQAQGKRARSAAESVVGIVERYLDCLGFTAPR